ncbi:acyl carrier protein [Ekhidna lutea]|uniref:Acyl carrier protein n=1 Tax=Ekhidna lutea TaxID=447679 RepID=A0A239FTS4_EKHLU|nr:phosphopantetheine-binding protein [Ekhidna lutea]SNS59552.1 acyl carrier protein [Ekhidna lutea]
MDKTKIQSELLDIIDAYLPDEIDPSNITFDQHLINDLKINSVHIVDIILDIEEQFGITIEDESIGKINTVGDALELVQSRISK